MIVARGDTIVVSDVGNLRFNLYRSDGTDLGSVPIDLTLGLPVVQPTSSGLLAMQLRPVVPGVAGRSDTLDALFLVAPNGTVLDTVLRFPSGDTFGTRSGSGRITLFTPEPTWAVTDDMHLLFGVNDEYRITLYASSGKPERVITKPFEGQEVTERDKELVHAFVERTAREAGAPPEAVARLASSVAFGTHFPAFASIMAGPQGTIWVQHRLQPSTLPKAEQAAYDPRLDAGSGRWDVFDLTGRFLGVITLPARFAPRARIDDLLYGIWRDDLDLHHVMVLRVGPKRRTDVRSE